MKLHYLKRVSVFSNCTENHSTAGEQGVQPSGRLIFVGGNYEDAVCPLRYLIEGVVDTVGIRQAVAFGDLVTLAGGPDIIECTPQAQFP